MKWAASQELEATLVAELDAKRTAIDEAEAAVEQLQERIRRESLDAGDEPPRHRRGVSGCRSASIRLLWSSASDVALLRRVRANRVGPRRSAKAKRAQAESDLLHAETSLEEVRAARAAADERVGR